MDDKRMIINELVPLYKLGSVILLGLSEDFISEVVDDGLVLEIDLKEKRIINNPWSGQKKLKFGFYYPIPVEERTLQLDLIAQEFDKNVIREMIDLLLNPSQDAIDSLIWLPKRLKEQK